jgi:hypothetical protein
VIDTLLRLAGLLFVLLVIGGGLFLAVLRRPRPPRTVEEQADWAARRYARIRRQQEEHDRKSGR